MILNNLVFNWGNLIYFYDYLDPKVKNVILWLFWTKSGIDMVGTWTLVVESLKRRKNKRGRNIIEIEGESLVLWRLKVMVTRGKIRKETKVEIKCLCQTTSRYSRENLASSVNLTWTSRRCHLSSRLSLTIRVLRRNLRNETRL